MSATEVDARTTTRTVTVSPARSGSDGYFRISLTLTEMATMTSPASAADAPTEATKKSLH
jgi:hypothetical protein